MKKIYLSFFLLFLILSSFRFADFFANAQYSYKETTDGKVIKSTWSLKREKKDFLVEETSSVETTSALYTEKFIIKKYTNKKNHEDTEYEMYIDQKQIVAKGKVKSKEYFKKIHLNGKLWIQDFKFGLKNFLKSSKSEFKFILISPKDFTSNLMVATKEGIENIKIDATNYKTQKIKITLPGFRGHFWKAEIWYNIKTNDLIKYVSNEGPGTPTTTLILDQKKL